MPRYGMEKVKAPDFVALGSDSEPIRKRNVLAALFLGLTYDWVIVGGTGTGAIRADAHSWLPDRFVINANGEIQSYDATFLEAYNLMYLSEVLAQTIPTSLAVGSQLARRAEWLLPMQMGHSYTPEEFGLPSKTVNEPSLTAYWRNGRNMVIGGDQTSITITNPVTELYERPYIDPVMPKGGFQPLLIKQQTKDVVQSGETLQTLDFVQAGHELRSVFIQAYKGGVAGGYDFVAADDVVTRLRLLVNGKPVVGETKTPWRIFQQLNKTTFGLAALRTGLVVLDAAEDKRTSRGELWTVTTAEHPYLEMDVVEQAGDVRVVVTSVYTAR